MFLLFDPLYDFIELHSVRIMHDFCVIKLGLDCSTWKAEEQECEDQESTERCQLVQNPHFEFLPLDVN